MVKDFLNAVATRFMELIDVNVLRIKLFVSADVNVVQLVKTGKK